MSKIRRDWPKPKENKPLTGYDIMFSGKQSTPSKQVQQGYGISVKDKLGSKVPFIADVGEIRPDDLGGV